MTGGSIGTSHSALFLCVCVMLIALQMADSTNSPTAAPTASPTNSTIRACTDSGCDSWVCFFVGVLIHIVGSCGINIGQNMQALALNNGGEPSCTCNSKPSRLWIYGMIIFISASMFTFGALALAPANVLVPLESVQFVVNLIFNRAVNKREITGRMLGGTVLTIVGIAMVVAFGSGEDDSCHDEQTLISLYQNTAWWVYLVTSFVISIISYFTWISYWRRSQAVFQHRDNPEEFPEEVTPMCGASFVEPTCFSISAALFGGGQMIVHSKVISELFAILFEGDIGVLNSSTWWFFWVELVVTCVFGLYWMWRLTQCLGMYDPIFIIPLMQTCFIVFGAIAGGIFFQEFDDMGDRWSGLWAWPAYCLGLMSAVAGLFLMAPPEGAAEEYRASMQGNEGEEHREASAIEGTVHVGMNPSQLGRKDEQESTEEGVI